MTPERLHCVLTRYIVKRGHAPSPGALANAAGCDAAAVSAALAKLAQMHGVILEPGSERIWSLHPFSMLPTAFWVTSNGRGWWANCAWCSLAIGAAIGADTEISTREGAEGVPLQFEVRNRESSRPDLLMHFPYAPSRWWDNPFCPCGNILFFSSESQIDEWAARHGRPKGAILKMPAALQLAQRWFGDYARPDWRRKTPEQAEAIFRELGLDRRFWNISGGFR